MMSSKKKIIRTTLVILVIGLAVGGYFAYDFYQKIFAPNVPTALSNDFVHIPTNSSFDEVVNILEKEHFIIDVTSFKLVAKQMNYIKNNMRAGRYKIEPNWSNRQLIGHLRGGKQATVKVILNNERLLEEVAGKVARFIEPDSASIYALMMDPNFLLEKGYTKETLMSIFIPNTYDFYWNTSPAKFMERMIKEHDEFWAKNGREDLLKERGMTKVEIYSLASIVERETNYKPEKQRMAAVYHNRLRIGMLLQADPTSVFARRDFAAKRVTDYHTKFDSPYNTYMYAGLPPGPVSMASISSIDAVLNPEDNKFLYFCAKGDGSGTHNFAKSLSQHNQNAITYKRNLKKRGLR